MPSQLTVFCTLNNPFKRNFLDPPLHQYYINAQTNSSSLPNLSTDNIIYFISYILQQLPVNFLSNHTYDQNQLGVRLC